MIDLNSSRFDPDRRVDVVMAERSLEDGGADIPSALTADALMVYLQTRLSYLDARVSELFSKQKRLQDARGALMEIQKELGRLKTENDGSDPSFQQNIQAQIDAIAKIDAPLAQKMQSDLSQEGQILKNEPGAYNEKQVDAASEYLDNVVKQLEASAQMEMIELQSLMSTRQTAIQLATNMISSIGQGPQAIASNIGK